MSKKAQRSAAAALAAVIIMLSWSACYGQDGKIKHGQQVDNPDVLLKLGKPLVGRKAGPFIKPLARHPERNIRLSAGLSEQEQGGSSEPTAPLGDKRSSITGRGEKAAIQEIQDSKGQAAPKVQGWGRNHAVSNYEDNQSSPSMVKDSQGRLFVAYDWLYSGTGKYEVWLARSVDGGNDWEDLFYLGDNNYNFRRPSLAVTANDRFFLFYQTDDTLGLQYIWSSDGDKWNWKNLIAFKADYPKCRRPRVAAKLKNDSARVAVVWEYDYYGNGSDHDIGYAYSRDGGANWMVRLNHIAYSASQERFPAICISDSLIAVAYELYGNWATNDSVDIRYSRTSGLTAATGDTFAWNVSTAGIATTRHDRQPALAASGRYLYLAGQRAYNDQDDYDILTRHTNDGGKTLRVVEINESFESSTCPPAGWTNGGCHHTTFNPRTGARALCFNAAGDYIITPKLANPDSVIFWYRRSSNTNAWACSVQYAYSINGPWTHMGLISAPTTTYQQYAQNLIGFKDVYIRLKDARPAAGAEERYVDDFWVPSEPFVFAAGTSSEERHPALWAEDTICHLGYFRDGTWAVHSKTVDQGYNWSAEEMASDSNSAVQGPQGLTISLLGENPRVAWTDNRNVGWGLGTDIYFNTNVRNFPRVCDLAPYRLSNWQYPLIPSKLKGTYVVSDTLRGMLTTTRDTTYVDLCLIDSSSVDVADTFRAGLFVDEWLYAYLQETRLPAWWPTGVIDYPMWVFGGRHTLSLYADYEERILYERTRANNIFSKQWVWTPYRLPDDTTLQVPTPPISVIDTSFPHYNCDGYWQASTNNWSAVGMKPAPGTNYALRIYTDAYGKAEGGFTAVAAESNLGADTVEVIAVNGNKLTSGTRYHPGVYREPKTGEGDYYLQFCLQDGIIPSNGWSGTQQRMGEYHLVHTYDVNLTSGLTYYAACSLAAGPASLGFAVFSPMGSIYKPRTEARGFINHVASPGRQFSFVADIDGWHALVVWHNTPGKNDTARYRVGVNTAPFGLPLAVRLAEFTATAHQDSIVLNWRTESEVESYQWLVERGTTPDEFSLLGTLPASGTSPDPREYRWCDRSAQAHIPYYYRIGEQALDGKITYYGPVKAMLSAGPVAEKQPLATPNPFGERTTIKYQTQSSCNASLKVYNIAGQRVRILADGPAQPGSHSVVWDGRDDMGSAVSAGCYFLRWEIGGDYGMLKILKVR